MVLAVSVPGWAIGNGIKLIDAIVPEAWAIVEGNCTSSEETSGSSTVAVTSMGARPPWNQVPAEFVDPYFTAQAPPEVAELLASGEARRSFKALAPAIPPARGAVDLGESWVAWLIARISLDEAAALIRPESATNNNSNQP